MNKREESVKDLIIRTIRGYLNEKKIAFRELDAETTNSYYFIISEYDEFSPAIRVSDHSSHKEGKFLAEFMYDLVGKNATKEKIRKRVQRRIDSGLKRLGKAGLHKAFDKIKDGEKND